MRLTFKQLEVFVASAKSENITYAAERLHLTQSACSMALSTLENNLGEFLFDRHGKRLILNDKGKILLEKAIGILDQAKELQNLMMIQKGILSGHLFIGASSTIGNYLLPKIIGDFMTEHPLSKITLGVTNTEQVIGKILQFDIDIGMIEGHCYTNKIEIIPWIQDELVIVASAKHYLSKKRNLRIEDIQQARWILREPGSGTREIFEEALSGQITPFMELGHTEAVKQAVRAGLGISCLSKITVINEMKSGELVELKAPFLKLTRNFSILVHKKKYRTNLLNTFLKKYLSLIPKKTEK